MVYLSEAIIRLLYALPILLIYLLIHMAVCKSHNTKMSVLHMTGTFVFGFYLICILTVTGTLTLDEFLMNGFSINPLRMNLQPLERGLQELNFDNLANICLFVPFGIILPCLWERYNNPLRTIGTGFLFSLLIETSQLFNRRATDVDDLIMNTLGTIIGYLLYQVIIKWFFPSFWKNFRINNTSRRSSILLKHEAFLLMLLIIACHFFILPYVPGLLHNIF